MRNVSANQSIATFGIHLLVHVYLTMLCVAENMKRGAGIRKDTAGRSFSLRYYPALGLSFHVFS